MVDTTYFAAKFDHMNHAQITWALNDIKETLQIWRDEETEYTRKLWAEWDYLIALKQAKQR